MEKKKGFTLIEVLIFTAIFAIIAGSFIAVLATIVSIKNHQSSSDEVISQGQALMQQINYYIESAKLVDMPIDTPTDTLKFADPSSPYYPLPSQIFVSTGTAELSQYLTDTLPLTSDKVTVSDFLFTRHFNQGASSTPYGTDSVSYSFTVSASSTQGGSYSKTFKSSASVIAPVGVIGLVGKTHIDITSDNVLTGNTGNLDIEPGSLLVAVVSYTGDVTSSVLDAGGNTWIQIASSTYATDHRVLIYAAADSSGGAPYGIDYVTADFGSTGASYPSISLYNYRGVATSSPFDASSSQTEYNNANPSSGFANPTSSVELLFGISSNDTPLATASAGTGYTLESASSSSNLYVEDQVRFVTGQVESTWQYSSAVSSTNILVTFRAAPQT